MTVSTVQPVNYQRARVSGLDSLNERMRQLDEDGRIQTRAVQAALAKKQQMDRIEEERRQQEALAQQQTLYNQSLTSAFRPGQAPGGNFGNFSASPLNDGSQGAKAVKLAEKYLGMPYRWGGSNPNTSFDCSGLVQYVYKQLGIKLPRVSNQQAMSGQRTSIANLRPGDLVAWDNSSRNNGADHIAIYAGNNTIIEAARKGTNIRYRKLTDRDRGAWGVRVNY